MRWNALGRWAARAAQVGSLIALAGCVRSCDGSVVVVSGLFVGLAQLPAKPTAGERYLSLRAKKDGFGANFRPNREVWKPFRFEASLGLPDPAHADLGAGSFGVSLIQISGGGFVGVTAKRSGTGVEVDAVDGATTTIGAATIPDTLFADVAIESSGSTAVVTARKPGTTTYVPVATLNLTPNGPYTLSLDVDDLPKGAKIGYADMRLRANGAPPSPTAAQTARETIYTGVDALAEAMYALNGVTPDRAAAGDQVAAAVVRLDAALAMDLSPFKGASKKLKSARKKADALVAPVRGKKSVASLFKALQSILTTAGQAADAVG